MRVRTKKNKKNNCKPPFYWPLILALVIAVEIVVLTKEKTWSQSYGMAAMYLRGQVEKITLQNNLINNYLYNFYSLVNYEFQAQRENMITRGSSPIVGARNEISPRY